MTTFLSLYAFGGVVFCALHHSHSADDFLENIHHYMVFSVGIAATSLIEQAVRSAWTSIVDLTSRR